MGSTLPALSKTGFLARLAACAPLEVSERSGSALWLHFEELRRWNPTLSLIGPGSAAELVERHYGEALAALPLLGDSLQTVVDVGSGAGFPGFVLAACRPLLDVTLVETNARKWAFLQAASRRAALPCRCLNVRVEVPLPEGLPATMDVLTARALKLDAIVTALDSRLTAAARILFWAGGESFAPPPGWRPVRELALPGSARRRIVELQRA